jgi:hypothetical protein
MLMSCSQCMQRATLGGRKYLRGPTASPNTTHELDYDPTGKHVDAIDRAVKGRSWYKPDGVSTVGNPRSSTSTYSCIARGASKPPSVWTRR